MAALSAFDSPLSIDNIQAADLRSLIIGYLTANKPTMPPAAADGGAAAGTTSSPNYDPEKFLQILYKLVFYQWMTDSKSDAKKTVADAVAALSNDGYKEAKKHLGINGSGTGSSSSGMMSYSSLSAAQKFIFTATDASTRSGFNTFFAALKNEDKKTLFDTAVSLLNASVVSTNNANARERINLIYKFIVDNKM